MTKHDSTKRIPQDKLEYMLIFPNGLIFESNKTWLVDGSKLVGALDSNNRVDGFPVSEWLGGWLPFCSYGYTEDSDLVEGTIVFKRSKEMKNESG